MLKKLFYNRKLMITVFVVLIIASSLVALGPMLYSAYMGRGVATKPVSDQGAEAASTELAGQWQVTTGNARNFTSAGFTIDEVLPSERRSTSGSTKSVTGEATVEGTELKDAQVAVDITALTTDNDVRDNNMKTKLFEVERHPEATFALTKPADVSTVPDNGTKATITVTGDLTIKGKTHEVTTTLDALRDGDKFIVGGNIPVNRLDYDIKSPEFLAAKIADEGTIDLRLTFEKK